MWLNGRKIVLKLKLDRVGSVFVHPMPICDVVSLLDILRPALGGFHHKHSSFELLRYTSLFQLLHCVLHIQFTVCWVSALIVEGDYAESLGIPLSQKML